MTIYVLNKHTRRFEECTDKAVLQELEQQRKPSIHIPFQVNEVETPKVFHYAVKPIIATNLDTLESFMVYGQKHLLDLGFNPSAVSRCCTGKVKHHRNYSFRFKDE